MENYRYFIETYTMPQGCDSWIKANTFPALTDENECYKIWCDMAADVKKAYPDARMVRNLRRRTAKKAFTDRESSICSREWLVRQNGKPSWKYRITMYVIKQQKNNNIMARKFNLEKPVKRVFNLEKDAKRVFDLEKD